MHLFFFLLFFLKKKKKKTSLTHFKNFENLKIFEKKKRLSLNFNPTVAIIIFQPVAEFSSFTYVVIIEIADFILSILFFFSVYITLLSLIF